ncbi:unnamed protein product [Leptosia nina]|uniref:Schwannomin interacting protein 1 C-terminal domain-containing protein n=1 Tax=Leptosia nina TaxID=320188 RepID=A0AAV1JLG6_9NEOP
MRIANNKNNGNEQSVDNNSTIALTDDKPYRFKESQPRVENYHLCNNINTGDNVLCHIVLDSTVCNLQFKLNNQNLEAATKIEEKSRKSLVPTFKEGANESNHIRRAVDEELASFDQSDSEEMSEDSIHLIPRGIVNPNYPGFQHLAHTLQEYSSNIENFYQSENEMTDDDIDIDITEVDPKSDANYNYEELNNNKLDSLNLLKNEKSMKFHHITNNQAEKTSDDIPDLLKTISKANNNNDCKVNCDITSFGTDIENNFDTKDIIGDFNKEVEDEIKQLLNYNINIQDDLEELRKDIKDNFEKPIESTINNISEVVNHVIKKLVQHDTSDDFKDHVNIDVIEEKIELKRSVPETNVSDIRKEINLSRPTFLLLDSCNDQIQDAALSDGKEEININEDSYDTQQLSNNVETTIKQLSTELRKIIPKLNEMRERDKMWTERPFLTDGNSNKLLQQSSNIPPIKYKEVRTQSLHNNKQKRNFYHVSDKDKAQIDTRDTSKYNAQYKTSVPQDNIVIAESDIESFEVYNIETALPKLDIDTIENYIKAAKDAERRSDIEGIEKNGVKRKFQIFKPKVTKSPERTFSISDNTALSPRVISGGDYVQTEIEWPIISDNIPNILDKFTRIVTIVDHEPYDRNKRNDREEIRKRLAMGIDSEEYYSLGHTDRPGKKPSLHSRLQNGFKFHPASLISKSSKSRSSQSLNHIELKESDFYALQATLQTEARIALAQAKELARIQMEHERRSRPVSPVTEMLRRSMEKANVPLAPDRRRVSRQILTDMNIAQLQVIVNELHSQIEGLNDTLVKLLMARDELHMGQDSMLVDIEDLTRYLGVKEQSKKSKGPTTKSGVRRLTSLVHK